MRRTPEEMQALINKRNTVPDTQRALDALTSNYPQFEKDTFWIQEVEARGYLADLSYPTPFIDNLISVRDISKDDMVAKIIANSDALKVASAQILGQYQQLMED